MSPILISFILLSIYTVIFAIAGFLFYNLYHEKLWIGIMLVPMIAVPIYLQRSRILDRFWPGMWSFLIWFSFCYLLGFLYLDIRKRSNIKLQKARDSESVALSASLEAAPGTNQKFALYLRPFQVTNNIPTSLPGTHYIDSEEGVLDFEAILGDAVQATMPLVALGRPLETYGAGRILTEDENWQAKIIPLMLAARIIFIVPSDRPGTMWEIEQILQKGLLEKCIFIMPPEASIRWTKEPEDDWQSGEVLVDQEGTWETTRQTLDRLGLHLPQYEQSGALFVLNSSGEPGRYRDLPLLLPKFTGSGGYAQKIRQFITELEDGNDLAPEYPDQPSAKKLDLLENEEVILDVKPGGFEWTIYPKSPQGLIVWFLFMILFCILFVLACRNIRYVLLLMAEATVAGLLVSAVGKVIGWIREP